MDYGDSETRRIPLRAKGGTVRAYALVDAEDFERFGHLRWHLIGPGRYAARKPHNGARNVFLHRLVAGLPPVKGDDPREVDHRNGNKLDNRRANLRVVIHDGNMQNVGSNAGATSRFRGVSWQMARGKWKACVQVNGTLHYLGLYEREEDAASVAAAFRREHMPYSADAA